MGTLRAGEGILGLRRAFEIAGVESLIMSLWRIRDDIVKAWMMELYRRRLAGASTADAVREASLRTLRRRRAAGLDTHPFWWGAFLAAGNWA